MTADMHGSPMATRHEIEAQPTAPELVRDTVEIARDVLGMDLAYVADTRADMQDYVEITGDAQSFGASVAEAIPLAGTYCGLLLEGGLDGLVRDARADPRVRDLAITEQANIGAYIGVPLELPDGSAFGTFCCLSHHADQSLRERDLGFMRGLARIIGRQLRRDQQLAADHQVEITAAHVRALLTALETRDGYTQQHSQAVVEMAVEIGRELGLQGNALADVEAAALLHDLGKIGVSDAILRKPGSLTTEEWREMHRHPAIGESVLRSMAGLSHLAPIVRAEHERWDGEGYPDGLAGEEIPLISRIVLVCDAFHAMTSDRPYWSSIGAEAAVTELINGAGRQFCPRTVGVALKVIDLPCAS